MDPRRAPRALAGAVAVAAAVLFAAALPRKLFAPLTSTVLLARGGELLGATIAADSQWRFPPRSLVPEKFRRAIVEFEDRRFYSHTGVDTLALARAIRDNRSAGRVVSGASTLTMQVIRLSRGPKPRTVGEKLVEMLLALRLEMREDKETILALFASHAPFGGNVVGLDAAAWRWFGRPPESLSWAESALLAVLPNNPSLMHPGRNREALAAKRDRLLEALRASGALDDEACRLALAEPLPPEPRSLPSLAPHLLDHQRGLARSSIDAGLQRRSAAIVERHGRELARAGITSAAALVLDVATGEPLAYIGNIGDGPGSRVDIIRAPRSTGSILKPLLYAAMLEAGEILPGQLVADVPTRYGAFFPQNMSLGYEGAVAARRALARSLNVPAVRMLQEHGVDRFAATLRALGMSTLHRPARDYGLSLILGGAEGTLGELTSIYAALARAAGGSGQGAPQAGGRLVSTAPRPWPIGAGAAWLTLEAMLEVERPDEDSGWRELSSGRSIAWKTGTSFGFRDAWAIGVTPRFAVGVWAGNADGQGRPGLRGSEAAAPILFELLDALPRDGWFERPDFDLVQVPACGRSGFRAGPQCEAVTLAWAPRGAPPGPPCPYCRLVHLDATLRWQVTSACEPVEAIVTRPWFVLPPAMEHYFRRHHSDYRPLPQQRSGCAAADSGRPALSLIYPTEGSRIYVPRELAGGRGRAVFQAAHRDAEAQVHWHLDDEYIATTSGLHQLSLAPEPGEHTLTIVDSDGARVQRVFTVLPAGRR